MPITIDLNDQDGLKAFLARRHPDYHKFCEVWNFLEATYEGGREWFGKNLFRYIKEGDLEWQARQERAYRFNHTREIVDLIQKYIFKGSIARNEDDASPEVKAFWEKTTRGGLSISQFSRLLCNATSKFGRVWVFTDTNKTLDVQTKADEKEAGVAPYAYIVKPQDVLDFGIEEDGDYSWVLVREYARDDSDPITSSGEVYARFRLWTEDEWLLFRIIKEKDAKGTVTERVAFIGRGTNDLGEIPGFPVDHIIGDNVYSSPALINDIAYLDRAIANYLSNLDAIIQDQTFSQLAMPAQNALPGDEKYNQLLEMGTKRIFLYDGDSAGKPEYLSPDPKQAGMVIQVINKIINEIYHSVGMAGERTKQDNAVGIDNSSGVAKAYDFDRLNSLLTMKSESLENAENRLNALISRWHGVSEPAEELTEYPDTFDVRSLYDEFTVAERLALIAAPDDVRQEQMKQVIDKLFPAIKADLKATMLANLKDWPPVPPELMTTGTVTGSPPTKFPATGKATSGGGNTAPKRNPQTSKRQGQVTPATGK